MKNSISLSFLLFTSFLVIGYTVSTMFYQPDYDGDTTYASVIIARGSNQTLNNGQYSLLLVSVNSLEVENSSLNGLWLVTYLPTDPTLHIFPILPSGGQSFTALEDKLYRSFNLVAKDGTLVLGDKFIRVLKDNNYWWSGYIVFDQLSWVELQSALSKGEQNPGNLWNQEFHNVIIDPQSVYTSQLEVIQNTCEKLAGTPKIPNWTPLTSLIPTHILTDLDIHQFTTDWETILSSGHKLSCSFPTLQISSHDQ